MRKAYKDYTFNGWNIMASEYNNDWSLYPKFEGEEDQVIARHENFANNEDIYFKTLKEAKAWTKTQEAEQIKNKY